MKIAFLATRLSKYDAISNYSVAMLKKLSDSNSVDLYTFVSHTEIPFEVTQYTYTKIKDHNLKSVLLSLTKIHRLAQKLSKYDMLILCNPDATILPSAHLAKRFNLKIKIIWDFHGITPSHYLYLKDRILTSIRNFASIESMKRSDLVLVRSEYIKRELQPHVNSRKIEVIPFGMDIGPFNNIDATEIIKKHNLNGRFVLLYVGRLFPHKRVDFLIKSIPHLSKDFVLIIVGGGIEKQKLENLALSLNVHDRTIFAGKVSDEDLPKYYAASDVFVTASMHEGFCVPIIESLASGKPAIVPNRTAMPEVVGDSGFVYDGSMEDFLNKLCILKDRASVESMNGHMKMAEKYDIKNVSECYKYIIEKSGRDING